MSTLTNFENLILNSSLLFCRNEDDKTGTYESDTLALSNLSPILSPINFT